MFALWDWISVLVGLVGSKVNFVRLAGSFALKYRSGICLLRAGWLSAALQECKIANEGETKIDDGEVSCFGLVVWVDV